MGKTIGNLTAIGDAVVATDLLEIEDDPGGTPASKKVTVGEIRQLLDNESVTFGTGDDATLLFNATNLVYNTAGIHSFTGANVHVANGQGLVVGNTAQIVSGEVTSEVQVLGTTETDSSIVVSLASTTDALSPVVKLIKNANATVGTFSTAVADNEELGKVQAYGTDGTDGDTLAAEIGFYVDDSGVGAGTIGGEIILATATTAGALTTALRVSNAQNVTIGTSSGGTKLEVQGDASSTNQDVAQISITGATASAKTLAIGFNTTGNYGFIQASEYGVDHRGLVLQPVANKVFIHETANANNSQGLTINQSGTDNEILSLKSSDVAHGTTDDAETDTYAFFSKITGGSGGLLIECFEDSIDECFLLRSVAETEDTTDAPTTTSDSNIALDASLNNAAARGAHGATANIFSIQNNGVNEFVVKGDGELYSNQSATVGTFDDEDDAIMAWDLAHHLANEEGKVQQYSRNVLERAGILNKGGMISLNQINQLLLCAVGQLGMRVNELEQKLLEA